MSDGKQSIASAIKGAKKVKAQPKEAASVDQSVPNSYLPEGCPVVPLGLEGSTYYYMDACRQLRVLPADKHGHLNLKSLFTPQIEFCEDWCPRYSKPDKDGSFNVIGTDWAAVSDALMNACGRIGPVNIEKKIRGPGGWLADDGRLVMHCGDLIYVGDQAFVPGRIGEHVYPAASKRPHPVDGDSGTAAAEEILSYLKTWNWRRGHLDPHLMMGWVGAAMAGAALDWRPLVWVTGDKATGKSTLHKLIQYLMGNDGMISSVDASAAGIRQAVGHMSLPVALDELEADEDNRKANDVIKIARYACSGGQSLRGGADHKGSTFTLMNCFMFSSILIPPMLSQDVSRMAILQLDRLEDVTPPTLEPGSINQLGSQFRRRMIARWKDFPPYLEAYRKALADVGHSGRSADQFGVLMACHDLLLFDGPPNAAIIEDAAQRLRYSALSETEDDVADWERCVSHLMTCSLDFFRNGEKRSVSSWIKQAAGKDPARNDREEANKALSGFGMRVREVNITGTPYMVLQVANAHQGLAALFRETHWTGKSGTSGVWVQSLRRVPYAEAGKAPTSFDGVMTRYTQLPIDSILSFENQGGETCLRV